MTATPAAVPRYLAVVPFLAAAVSGSIGVVLLRPVPAPVDPVAWREAPARVVETITAPCGRRPSAGTCHRPVAEYTADGVTRKVAARSRSRRPDLHTGDRVIVLYDPAGKVEAWLQPEYLRERRSEAAARRREMIGRYVWAAIGLFVAALCALIAAGILFARHD